MIPKSSRFKCCHCGYLKKRPGKCVWCGKIADFDNLMGGGVESGHALNPIQLGRPARVDGLVSNQVAEACSGSRSSDRPAHHSNFDGGEGSNPSRSTKPKKTAQACAVTLGWAGGVNGASHQSNFTGLARRGRALESRLSAYKRDNLSKSEIRTGSGEYFMSAWRQYGARAKANGMSAGAQLTAGLFEGSSPSALP